MKPTRIDLRVLTPDRDMSKEAAREWLTTARKLWRCFEDCEFDMTQKLREAWLCLQHDILALTAAAGLVLDGREVEFAWQDDSQEHGVEMFALAMLAVAKEPWTNFPKELVAMEAEFVASMVNLAAQLPDERAASDAT